MSQNPSYPVQPPPVQKASFWSRWWWMILLIIPLCCCAVVAASIIIISILGLISPEINAVFGDISGEFGVVPTPILRVATQAPMLEPTAMLPPTEMPPPTFPPEPTVPVEAPYEYFCDDLLGCVRVGANEQVHIAWALAVSGVSASLGEDEKGGIEIALLDRDYQILDHPILLTGEDTFCSPDGGAAAGEKLAADPTIVGIIGTSCSSEARAAMPAISQAGMVMISPSNSHPDLTVPTHPDHHAGYFRTYPNDRYQGQVAAEFAYQILGLRRAVTISDGGQYSEELIDAFVETFTAMGGQVVAQETVEPNAVDAMPELINIVGKSPQVIYLPLFMNEGKLVATQVKEYGPLQDVSLVTSDMLFSPYFLEQMGQPAEGMYMTGLYENTQNPAYQVFLDKWADQYGDRLPGIYRTHAYDATNLLLDAIEKVAIQMPDGTLYIPRQALRDALYGVRNYPGLTGILNCNENGDCGSPKAFGVYQITQAEIDGSWPPPVFWYP